ncbi:MAG: transposase [bacterium]|nr:transposase [bacterium]
MPRIARIIAEGFPHHITQRGNRKQKVFFSENDYREYLDLLHSHSKLFNLDIESYCLMPNHVHLILVPHKKGNLALAVGRTHQKYTGIVNKRENWRGYLWQGRFSSFILDEKYLLAATRYLLLNPVRAGMVKKPWDYKWSSARHHLGLKRDPIITGTFLKDMVDDWRSFLSTETGSNEEMLIKLHERTGRPLGEDSFVEKLEKMLNIKLRKNKPGPKPKRRHN